MKKLFRFPAFFGKSKNPEQNRQAYCLQIVAELRKTREALDCAYDRFESEQDEMMLDCIIYEIESLRAKYRYLLRVAKEEGAICDRVKVFP